MINELRQNLFFFEEEKNVNFNILKFKEIFQDEYCKQCVHLKGICSYWNMTCGYVWKYKSKEIGHFLEYLTFKIGIGIAAIF